MDANALLDLLGNENRRRILRLLSRKPCYVTEISEHLAVSPKAVIDHLRKLEESGLIESRTDEKRRKYFHIAENVRLEVTLAPHDFGLKSAYPANPSLDLSRCQYLSLETSIRSISTTGSDGDTPDLNQAEISALIEELDELEDLERELSLAQRWVQGRIGNVLERLSKAIDSDAALDTEIMAALANGHRDLSDLGSEVGAPVDVLEEHLRYLEDRGVVEQAEDGWTIATA